MFNKTFTAQIQREIQAAMTEITKRHGLNPVQIDFRRCRDGSFGRVMKFDLEPLKASNPSNIIPVVNHDPSLNEMFNLSNLKKSTGNASTLQEAMMLYGLKPANSKGDRLISYNPKTPKNKFIYESAGGTKWRCSVDLAKRRFGC